MEILDDQLPDTEWEEILLCGECGAEVTPSRGGKPRRWCSDACRVRNYYRNNPDKREEQKAADRRRHSENHIPQKSAHEHICVECSGEFVTSHRSSKYCSIRCAGRASRRRRRARLRGVDSDDFTFLEVAERDGWTCKLCHQPVDPRARKPDRRRGSIDHILPISLGGHNTWNNVQLAHLSCNCSKGPRTT
ncbi:HNH endonuclease [Kocuria rosea]|uniref:HNH endonuclease n=1 Tax=Kocuria rosea TaxID=1275 RepID=UPI003D325AD2